MFRCLDVWPQNNLKPYQGLKLGLGIDKAENNDRPKQPKTLSGIETKSPTPIEKFEPAENNLKPYQGLKH